MRRRITFRSLMLIAFFLFGGCVSLSGTELYAAGFGLNFLNPKRVEADPKKTYPLETNHGPYMIMVKQFSGENAQQNANRLVYELRKRYKLKAYVYDRKFEFKVADGMRSSEKKQHLYNQYAKTSTQEYAVLVGDFHSTDDEEYKKALKTVKTSQPECLKGEILQVGASKKSPLANAFGGITNPLLPPDIMSRKGVVDPFVERLNSDCKYSLLNCPARYTVRVATFTGNIEIRPGEVQQIIAGKKEMDGQALIQAGVNAAKLCQALREKGYEAYEFHDRYSSIVTVGSFNEIQTMGPQGLTIRPEIVKIFDTFQPTYQENKSFKETQYEKMLPYKPKKLIGIEFDILPQVVMVPKRIRDVK